MPHHRGWPPGRALLLALAACHAAAATDPPRRHEARSAGSVWSRATAESEREDPPRALAGEDEDDDRVEKPAFAQVLAGDEDFNPPTTTTLRTTTTGTRTTAIDSPPVVLGNTDIVHIVVAALGGGMLYGSRSPTLFAVSSAASLGVCVLLLAQVEGVWIPSGYGGLLPSSGLWVPAATGFAASVAALLLAWLLPKTALAALAAGVTAVLTVAALRVLQISPSESFETYQRSVEISLAVSFVLAVWLVRHSSQLVLDFSLSHVGFLFLLAAFSHFLTVVNIAQVSFSLLDDMARIYGEARSGDCVLPRMGAPERKQCDCSSACTIEVVVWILGSWFLLGMRTYDRIMAEPAYAQVSDRDVEMASAVGRPADWQRDEPDEAIAVSLEVGTMVKALKCDDWVLKEFGRVYRPGDVGRVSALSVGRGVRNKFVEITWHRSGCSCKVAPQEWDWYFVNIGEAPRLRVSDVLQALPGQELVKGSVVVFSPGDAGEVRDVYCDDSGEKLLEISWRRSGCVSRTRVDSWPEKFWLLEEECGSPKRSAAGSSGGSASQGFAVGDTVEVRDKESEPWMCGTVTSVQPLKVLLDDWDHPFGFRMVQRCQ